MDLIKKGDNWFLDYRVYGRREREKVGSNKKLAEIAFNKRKVEIAENKVFGHQKGKQSFVQRPGQALPGIFQDQQEIL